MPTADPFGKTPDATTHPNETPGKKPETGTGNPQQEATSKLRSDAGGHVDEGYENHYTAARNATGMDTPPPAGSTNGAARSIDNSTSRGEGISRGQNVSYTGENGQSINGGQYTNSEGTYFKTTSGDTYRVQSEQNGGYRLEPTKPGQDSIDASRVQVNANSFGNRPDSGANDNGNRGDLNRGNQGEAGANRGNQGDNVDGGANRNRVDSVDSSNRGNRNDQSDGSGTRGDGSDRSIRDGADGTGGANRVANQGPPKDAPEPAQPTQREAQPTQQTQRDQRDVQPAQQSTPDARENPHPSEQQQQQNQRPPEGQDKQRDAQDSQRDATSTNQRSDPNRPDPQQNQRSEPQPTQRDGQPTQRDVQQDQQNQRATELQDKQRTDAQPTPRADAQPTPRADAQPTPRAEAPPTPRADAPPTARADAPPTARADAPPPQHADAPPIQPKLSADGKGVDGKAPGADRTAESDRITTPAPHNPNSMLPGAGPDGKLASTAGQDNKVTLGPDGKPLIGQVSVDRIGQVIDPVTLGKGQINPADFVKGADGKALPVQDNNVGKVAAGADLHATTLAGLKDGSDPSRLANPALKTMIPGLDLTDGQNRALTATILQQMQATKDGGGQFKLQNFQDLTKGMDAKAVASLQGFLFPDGRNLVSDQAAGRLTALLAPGQDKLTGSGAIDAQARALQIGKIGELAKGTTVSDLAGQNNSKTLIQDIGKVMQDTNKLLTMDGKDALTLAQLISKSLDATRAAGDRTLEGKGALDRTLAEKPDPANFVVKAQTGQDPLVRLLNEKAGLMNALEGKREAALTVPSALAQLDGKIKAPANADLPGGKAQVVDTSKDKDKETKTDAAKDKEADEKDIAAMLNAVELEEGKKKPIEEEEEEEKKAQAKHEMDERAKQEALLALMAEKKLKEQQEKAEKEKERQQQAKKDEESRRRRYIVKDKDTLESIATKQLKDVKLAALIYDINRSVIQSKKVDEKDVVDLRPGLVIWLPSTADISKFQKEGAKSMASQVSADEELRKRFGDGWDGTASGAKPEGVRAGLINNSNVGGETRRENIEKMLGSVSKKDDGQLKYVVRLGDSLKSIAMKHPALQDVALWKLLACVNELDQSTDDKGSPIVKLARGSTLIIPETMQIEEYCSQQGIKVRRNTGPGKICDSCKAVNTVGTTICGACGHVFAAANPRPNIQKPDHGTKSGEQVLQKTSLDSSDEQPISLASVQKLYAPDSELTVTDLDDQSRLTHCDLPGDPESTVVSVEVLHEGTWQAVIAYEIHPAYSIRYEFSPDGNRRNVRIDIPVEAALTLSSNDLNGNWKNYRDRYSAQVVSLRR